MKTFNHPIWIALLTLALQPIDVHAGSCSTSKGVNLSSKGMPFENVRVRDQGSLGTCFSYAGCDLLQSSIRGKSPFNPLEAAVNSDEDVDGGDPLGVIKSLSKRGWACTDTTKFQNFFPSKDNNLLTELEKIWIDMPVYYTYDPEKNEARQMRIAKKAAAIEKDPKSCNLVNECSKVNSQISALNSQVGSLMSQNVSLEKEKNILDWGWLNYLCGSRDNSEIQSDIDRNKSLINSKEKSLEALEKRNESLQNKLAGKNDLDKYSEDEAAKIVHFWGKRTYSKLVSIFKSYGIDSKNIPSFEQFITERVQKDPVKGYAGAGRMYGYKLIKRAMANACQPPNRQAMSPYVRTGNYEVKVPSEGVKKIKGFLEKGSPEGAILTLHSSFLQTGGWSNGDNSDLHAVVVMGCRTVNGELQFLIHNSWGSGCSNYSSRFSCQSGRVWVPASSALSASLRVGWIE